MIPVQGGIKSQLRVYKGRMCIIPKIKSKGRVMNLREESMGVQGAHLWNSLPMSIRIYGSGDTSMNGFKAVMGVYLRMMPDKPRDVTGGWYPNPTDTKGHFSNSLMFWSKLLQQSNSYYY